MNVLTNKDDEIIAISKTCEVNEELRNINLDDYAIAYGPDEMPNIYEVKKVPEEVEIAKYCYTEEDGFYKNPNYVKHYSVEDRLDLVESIINLQLGF